MSPLAQIIRSEMATLGPMSFARFMELALYHPQWGYYERPGTTVGRGGDYCTSVSVGPVFGELLGFRFASWLSALPAGRLQVVEGGAHDGQLAADVLAYLDRAWPALAGRLEYWVLEPSANRRLAQAVRLRRFGQRVRWARNWDDLPPIRGLIFGNELLDALPVHRLVWSEATKAWRQQGVTWADDAFAWAILPGEPRGLAPAVPPALAAVLPEGFATEVGQAAIAWWRRAARTLETGWLVAIDYGDGPGERFRPGREAGTLRAYRGHQISPDVLADPGSRDLTAHLDFGAVQVAGEANGLRTAGLWRQEEFLGTILRDLESGSGGFPAWTSSRLRQCQTLLHPAHFGASFKVLVQRKETG